MSTNNQKQVNNFTVNHNPNKVNNQPQKIKKSFLKKCLTSGKICITVKASQKHGQQTTKTLRFKQW